MTHHFRPLWMRGCLSECVPLSVELHMEAVELYCRLIHKRCLSQWEECKHTSHCVSSAGIENTDGQCLWADGATQLASPHALHTESGTDAFRETFFHPVRRWRSTTPKANLNSFDFNLPTQSHVPYGRTSGSSRPYFELKRILIAYEETQPLFNRINDGYNVQNYIIATIHKLLEHKRMIDDKYFNSLNNFQ